MASTNSVGSTPSSGSTTNSSDKNTLNSLQTQDFIKMLVAELQNQDPMSPMSNSELLTEVSQIRSIESNDNLNTTLQSVLLGQHVATASSLINQSVSGLDSDGNRVTGRVDSVSVNGSNATLHVGSSTIDLSNVTSVQPPSTTATTTNSTNNTGG
jgi:flagellar basal-body rod modification protein FlgD